MPRTNYGNAEIENPEAYAAAIKRRIIQNARTTFCRTEPRADEVIEFLAFNARGDFLASMDKALENWGKLTPGQMAAVCRIIDTRKAEAAAKHTPVQDGLYVGTVGQRVELTLTVRRVFTTPSDFGLQYTLLCDTPEGANVVYRGTSKLAEISGVTLTLKATIKEHGQYKGRAQTVINRPALKA